MMIQCTEEKQKDSDVLFFTRDLKVFIWHWLILKRCFLTFAIAVKRLRPCFPPGAARCKNLPFFFFLFFLQKLHMWVTLKPVYIFRRRVASCTVILMLTALSASARISDSYMCGTSYRKRTQEAVFRREKTGQFVGFFRAATLPNVFHRFVFTCVGPLLSGPGGLNWKMTDDVRWTDNKCRRSFIGFPFSSTVFGHSPRESVSHTRKNSRTEEKEKTLRQPVCQKRPPLILSPDQFLIPPSSFHSSIHPLTPPSFPFLFLSFLR